MLEDGQDRLGDLVDRRRLEVQRGVAADLGQRARARNGDRRARCHRLERRLAEALVEAREDERRSRPVERGELVACNAAADVDALRDGAEALEAGAGEDEPELRPSLPHAA